MIKLPSLEEFLSRRIEDTPIFEMAYNRKKILDVIRGLQNPINEHLIKILKYKDNTNINKHINDLETWLYDIQDMDFLKANKKLKSKDYFLVLCEEPMTSVNNIQYIINKEKGKLRKYKDLEKIRTTEEVMILLFELHKIIAKDLANNSISDFFIYLNKLIKK